MTIDWSPTDAYRKMRVIRTFEQQCLDLAASGEIAGSVHVCIGQEAIPVGATAALEPDDRMVTTYRGHGWAVAAGVPLRELMGELCQRAGGVNGGRAGSAYLSAPSHGIVGENSIVGAGVPIGAGHALASKLSDAHSVTIVSVGDGAMNQGSLHEGIVFAVSERLPLVIICENNGWSEMTPTERTVHGSLTDRVRGYGMRSVDVDGNDPVAVRDAVLEATRVARNGGGPVFLNCRTVRLSGHYNRDIQHYRGADDAERAARDEPLVRLRASLVADGVSESELDAIDEDVAAEVRAAVAEALAMPVPDASTARDHVYAPIVDSLARPTGEPTQMTVQMALNTALSTELEHRPECVLFGEDVGFPGGIFGVSRRLQKRFGAARVFDTPISESAILGAAVGASAAGLRPIVEIMWADFLLVAMDQLVNQAANVRYISRGAVGAPLVVRTQQGVTPGSCAQHSQSLEALLAHIPGLRVGLPVTAQDAYAMLRAAVNDPDPCIIIEARSLYQQTGEVQQTDVAEAASGARTHAIGSQAVIITWGTTVPKAVEAASALATEGISVGVVDLRWLNPIDDAAIAEAVAASGGRVLVAHEANVTGGFGAEIAARIQDAHFSQLSAPVARLGVPDTRIPSSPTLQDVLLPSVEAIVTAARDLASAEAVSR